MLVRSSIVAGLLALIAGSANAQSLCDQAKAAVSGLPVCFPTPHGVVLGRNVDKSEAEAAARYAADGEPRFLRHFGKEVPRYAVVYGFQETRAVPALMHAGFKAVLPWLNHAEKAQSAEASARQAVESQMQGKGLSPEQIKDIADQAASTARDRLSRRAQDNDVSAIPHELGHNWFAVTYWPGSRIDQGRHYGGPAPDWLDETAAILMEGDAFVANRRDAFKSAYTGGQPNQLYALPALLHMAHPMLNLQNQIKSQMAASGETVGVRVIGKDDARRQGLDVAGNFYSENRVFADFLIERTKDPAIFGSIAEALGQGRTIEQWLSTIGKANGLAVTVDGLDQQWREWLALKFGPAATGLFKQ